MSLLFVLPEHKLRANPSQPPLPSASGSPTAQGQRSTAGRRDRRSSGH